jgi:hypothetical protein
MTNMRNDWWNFVEQGEFNRCTNREGKLATLGEVVYCNPDTKIVGYIGRWRDSYPVIWFRTVENAEEYFCGYNGTYYLS